MQTMTKAQEFDNWMRKIKSVHYHKNEEMNNAYLKVTSPIGVVRNSNHLIWLVRPNANYVYNKYQILEWYGFWDEIKHPSFKKEILKKYNLK